MILLRSIGPLRGRQPPCVLAPSRGCDSGGAAAAAGKHVQRKGIGHRAVAGQRGVQAVVVQIGTQMGGPRRVAQERVEIQHRIKATRLPDPLVQRHAINLVFGLGLVEATAAIRQHGGRDQANTARVRPVGQRGKARLHFCQQASARLGRGGPLAVARAQVVDANQHHGVGDARAVQHVAVEARDQPGALPIAQQSAAADAGVDDRRSAACIDHAAGQRIGPALVAAGRHAVTIGDGVAGGHQHRLLACRCRVSAHVHRSQVPPAFARRGVGPHRSVDTVAGDSPTVDARTRMNGRRR